MNKGDMVRELMKYTIKPASQEQIENCIRHLPAVKKRGKIFPILKLQVSYIPKWIYLVSFMSFVLFAITAVRLGWRNMLYMSDAFALCFSVVLFCFVILSDDKKMQEIENSCRYNYSYILFARVILVTGFMIVLIWLTNLFVFSEYQKSLLYLNMVFLLPIFVGLSVTMVVVCAFQIRRTTHMIGLYMIVSILSDITLYRLYDFMSENLIVLAAAVLVCMIVMVVSGKYMLERKFIYEAYNI